MSIRVAPERHLQALAAAESATLGACLAYGNRAAERLVRAARAARPWTDRTRAARNALTGRAQATPAGVRVELAHGAAYGVYLETIRFRHKGRLGVLYPTLRRLAPEIISGWARAAGKGG